MLGHCGIAPYQRQPKAAVLRYSHLGTGLNLAQLLREADLNSPHEHPQRYWELDGGGLAQ